MDNNRNFTRVDFVECVSLKHGRQVFFGDIKNMSLKGLFVNTTQEVPLNTALDITVYHLPNHSIRLHAVVVRCEETGIAMQIKDMDVHSFAHLRDIIAMQCNDQDLIIRETYKMASTIH
ncbi:MAG: PilZ domain-containing protein [Geobacteraceae bacterium]